MEVVLARGVSTDARGALAVKIEIRILRGTRDIDPIALVTKVLYRWHNQHVPVCRELGYWCEWVYPYGFVPEAGCPLHD